MWSELELPATNSRSGFHCFFILCVFFVWKVESLQMFALLIFYATNEIKTFITSHFSNYVHNKSSQLELSLGYVTRMCSDTKAWQTHLFSSLGLQTNLLKTVMNSSVRINGVDISGRVNMLQTLHQTGSRECSQISSHVSMSLWTQVSADLVLFFGS